MEQINVRKLRKVLPNYDTADLYQEWERALDKLAEATELDVYRAMSVGTRRILYQCLLAMGARSVLDIGTYVGTSAACFALAVKRKRGHVVTVDVRDANAPNGFWAIDERPHSPRELMHKLGVGDNVEFVTCSGNDYLRRTKRTFDFICLDAGKSADEDFITLTLALDKLNPKGLIFVDDVFPNGEPFVEGGYAEPGPWLALEKLRELAPIRVHQLNKTLEGADIRCAFITNAS